MTNDTPPIIGKPLANVEVYVLDEYLNPAGIGMTGELYHSGPGLARGYLNRPELTAERFIPHPFSHEPGARLYRTGDLVKYQPDGNLVFSDVAITRSSSAVTASSSARFNRCC